MIRSDRSASARSTIARRSGSSEQRPASCNLTLCLASKAISIGRLESKIVPGEVSWKPSLSLLPVERIDILVHDRHSTVTDGSQYRYVTSIQRCTTLRDDAAGWYILAASPDAFRRRRSSKDRGCTAIG